jgi:hypothetical protein
MNVIELLRAFKSQEIDENKFLRAVVGYPNWHVAVDERNCAKLWSVGDKTYIAVMAEPAGPGDGSHLYLRMGGRHLVRHLPEDADGAGFEMSRPHGLGLTRDVWPQLLKWANVLDSESRVTEVEDRLTTPGPDQAELLHRHEWIVLCTEQGVPAAHRHGGVRSLVGFTREAALRTFLERGGADLSNLPRVHMTLVELAETVGEAVHFDAIRVNPGREPEWDPWPPGALADIRAGRDPRPEARILTARSIAELHHFLTQEGMSEHDRGHQLEYWNDTLVAHYHGTMLQRRAKSYRFEPVAPTPDPLLFGEGVSTLLCPGYILEVLDRRLGLLPTSASDVCADDRPFVAETARLADELVKLLGDHECLPRSLLRTVRGAKFVRESCRIADRPSILNAHTRIRALAGRDV